MHSKFHRTLLLIGALAVSSGILAAQKTSRAAKAKKDRGSKTTKQVDYVPGKEPYFADIGFTFTEELHEWNNLGPTNWVKGGSGDIGFTFWHGFGIAGNITGQHSPAVADTLREDWPLINPNANYPIPFDPNDPANAQYLNHWHADLGKFSYAVGPRYTWDASRWTKHITSHRVTVFGQFLIGETHSFNTYIPYVLSHTDTTLPPFGTYDPSTVGRLYNFDTTNTCVSEEGGGGIDIGLKGNWAIRAIQGSWIRTHVPDGRFNRQEDVRLGAGIVFRARPKH